MRNRFKKEHNYLENFNLITLALYTFFFALIIYIFCNLPNNDYDYYDVDVISGNYVSQDNL